MPDWSFFRNQLQEWYEPDRRPMPWKGQKNPYFIWLSEIILQQTRVEQGWAYFEKFRDHYPDIHALANAEDEAVMKDWEGLGYYSRARNLLKAARLVSKEMDGVFPNNYADLLKLPGVGPYTAAAIASFAFEEPVAVLDGNVYRILARYAAEDTPIDTTAGKKIFTNLAQTAFDPEQPAVYNQAIMDFGALVCKPKQAACHICPLAEKCAAHSIDLVYKLPVKAKKLKKRTRYFHFLMLQDASGRYLIQQRLEKDIWRDLHQFPMIEAQKAGLTWRDIIKTNPLPANLDANQLAYIQTYPVQKQQLTHQTIIGCFYELRTDAKLDAPDGFVLLEETEFAGKAFPKMIASFISRRFSDKDVFLDLFS